MTEGAGSFKPKRIGIVQTLKFHSVQLRETFDVVAYVCEVAEAREEFNEVFRARRNVGAFEALTEWQAGDLAGACGDRRAHEMLVDLDRAADIPASLFVMLDGEEHIFLHQVVGQLRHRMARSGDALADGVRREEVAQDDPEPVHAGSMASGFGPAESTRLRPTNLWAWGLILHGALESSPRDWGKLFPRFWAAGSTVGAARASLRDACRQAQDEAFTTADEAYGATALERVTLSLSKDEARLGVTVRPFQRLSSRASRRRDPGSIVGVSGWLSGSRIALRASGMTSGGGVNHARSLGEKGLETGRGKGLQSLQIPHSTGCMDSLARPV